MKKIFIIISILSISACTTQKTLPGGYHEFNAVSAGMQPQTKTCIVSPNPYTDKTNSAGLAVNWNKDDEIAVFDTYVHKFTCTSSGALVRIKGDISEDFTGTYYAMYPYSSCKGFEGGKFSTRINSNQYISEGGHWDPSAPVVVGSCAYDEETIQFYNANSLIALYLPAPAKHATILVNGEETITGDFSVDVESLEITKGDRQDNLVTINGSMDANTPYYMTLIPSTVSSGFSLYVNYADSFELGGTPFTSGEYRYKTSAIFRRNRITILDMESATPERMSGPLYIHPHLEQGTYILRSDDGSVILSKYEAKKGADKVSHLESHVYDFNKEGPIETTVLSEYQMNQKGWHDADSLVPDEDEQPRYRIKISGTGIYDGYYLRYDPELQGFYMVSDRELATLVYVYQISE